MIVSNTGIEVVQRPLVRPIEINPISDPDCTQHRIRLTFGCGDIRSTVVDNPAIVLNESLHVCSPACLEYRRYRSQLGNRLGLCFPTAEHDHESKYKQEEHHTVPHDIHDLADGAEILQKVVMRYQNDRHTRSFG